MDFAIVKVNNATSSNGANILQHTFTVNGTNYDMQFGRGLEYLPIPQEPVARLCEHNYSVSCCCYIMLFITQLHIHSHTHKHSLLIFYAPPSMKLGKAHRGP